MPLVLQQTSAPLTVDKIRMFLRDMPDYNILLEDVEFTNENIELAMELTIAKFNAMTPQSNLTVPTQLNEWVLLCGTCSKLLRSEGLRQLRNQMTAQDGNISGIGVDEKQALYSAWADRLDAEFSEMAQNIKIQNNMEAGYRKLWSGYITTGGWAR